MTTKRARVTLSLALQRVCEVLSKVSHQEMQTWCKSAETVHGMSVCAYMLHV